MTLLLTLLACDGAATQETDSQSTADDTATDDTQDTQPLVAGEDLVFHDGVRFSVFYNADYALEESAQPKQELGGGSSWTALADFDGDGHDDLWQLPDDGGKLSIYMNDGQGTWDTEPAFSPDSNAYAKRPVVAGDFDGDGKDDIGLFNTRNGKFVVFPLKVAQFSTDDKTSTETSLGASGSYTAADMDGDGVDDIIQLAGSDVRIYRVVDGVLIDPETPWWTGNFPGTVDAVGIDLDDDGIAQLALWSGSTLTIYAQGEDGPDLNNPVSLQLGAAGTPHAAQVR